MSTESKILPEDFYNPKQVELVKNNGENAREKARLE